MSRFAELIGVFFEAHVPEKYKKFIVYIATLYVRIVGTGVLDCPKYNKKWFSENLPKTYLKKQKDNNSTVIPSEQIEPKDIGKKSVVKHSSKNFLKIPIFL